MTNAQKFYQAMNTLGLSEELIKSVLPDWWDDELFNNVTCRAMAEIYISRATGKAIIEMRAAYPEFTKQRKPCLAKLTKLTNY